MYHSIGIINDEKVPGLESISNYMKTVLAKMNQPSTNTITTLLKNNTTKKHLTYTVYLKPKRIILNMIYIYIYIYR